MGKFRYIYCPPKRIDDATYSVDVAVGADITGAIAEVISLARGLNVALQFEFNGVTISVRSDSDPELIQRDWSRALNGYIEQNVGPYPTPILTEAEQENDARVEAENERKRQERDAQYEAKARAKRDVFEAKLAEAPEMDLADEKSWRASKDISQDPYSAGVVAFAERWARLMQREMANGQKLEDVAKTTSHEADIDGLSGFMYGCAVMMLAHCWQHGEQLRRWHNLDAQIKDEGEKANESGGVLNPALLSVR